jgi:phenylacetate-CoA ligase
MNLLGYARFYAIDLLRGTNVLNALTAIQNEQYKSYENLMSISNERNTQLLEYANKQVPFYKSFKTAEQFPVLTKALVKTNPEGFKSVSYRGKLDKKATGGSTGIPLIYLTTREAQSFMWAGIIHSWKIVGYNLGDKVAFIAGTAIAKQDFKHQVFYSLMNVSIYSAFNMTEETILAYLISIKENRIKLIYGYPTAINFIASYLNNHQHLKFPDLKGIVVTSEVLENKHRLNIQNAFHVPVRNQYGCNEAGISAFECENGNLHLINTASKISFDQDGNLLGTNLVNKGFVLINYHTGDKLSINQSQACACKRGYPIISEIIGRSVDMIVDMKGISIHSAFFSYLFRPNPEIEQFQIQFNESDIDVYIQVNKDLSYQFLYDKYIQKVKQYFKFENYHLHVNTPFLISTNAKHRYVIDNRKKI